MTRVKPSTKSSKRWAARSSNFFGALGYLIVTLQWVIAVALFTPLLNFLPANPAVPVETPIQNAPVDSATNIVGFIFVFAITAIMAALTIVILIKLPMTIVRSSRKVVKKSSSAVTTAALKVTHKKDTKKRRLTLQPRVIIAMKAVLLVAPLCFAYLSRFVPDSMLNPDMALFSVVLFANFAMGAFLIQYAIAWLTHVDKKDIW